MIQILNRNNTFTCLYWSRYFFGCFIILCYNYPKIYWNELHWAQVRGKSDNAICDRLSYQPPGRYPQPLTTRLNPPDQWLEGEPSDFDEDRDSSFCFPLQKPCSEFISIVRYLISITCVFLCYLLFFFFFCIVIFCLSMWFYMNK